MDTRRAVAEALGKDWHVRQDRPGVLLASTETAAIYVVDRPGGTAGVSVTVSTDEGGDLPRVLRALRAALAGDVRTWSGKTIGRYRVTGRAEGWRDKSGRRTPLVCYRVRLADGRCYVGRGLGWEMSLKCRRAAQDSF